MQVGKNGAGWCLSSIPNSYLIDELTPGKLKSISNIDLLSDTKYFTPTSNSRNQSSKWVEFDITNKSI